MLNKLDVYLLLLDFINIYKVYRSIFNFFNKHAISGSPKHEAVVQI